MGSVQREIRKVSGEDYAKGAVWNNQGKTYLEIVNGAKM